MLQNYTSWIIPYRNLYKFADKLLTEKNDFSCLLVSGRPFQLFRFGWLLHKKFGLKWIADYRDEWSTCQWRGDYNLLNKFICKLEATSERKWIKNASAIISCSDYLVNSVRKFVEKDGYNILNGFEPIDYITESISLNAKSFIIVYNGTLYPTQEIEVFIEAIKLIIEKHNKKIDLKIKFPGLLMDTLQVSRVQKLIIGYEKYFEISPRVTKREVIILQQNSDLLLMIGHKNVLGNFSSKIFEYLGCKRPILLCPTDNDVIANLVLTTQTGFVCANAAEAFDILDNLIFEKLSFGKLNFNPDKTKIENYTREVQTKKLASVLDKIC